VNAYKTISNGGRNTNNIGADQLNNRVI